MNAYALIGSKSLRLPPLPTVRDLVKLYKLRAIKQLSQNFLLDERLTDKIVKSAGKISGDIVLEVGPGPGCITRSILKKFPSRLILVEKDSRFLPTLEILKECVEPLGVHVDIYQGDILKFDIEKSIPANDQRIHLIGNLPFAISTRLLINWLNDISLQQNAFRRMDTTITLTFQKEVAERICAGIGHEQRCRLSIMSQIWTEPFLKFIISGKAFVPKPEVDVGVVRIVPLKKPKTNLPFLIVEKVIRHIFSMRQKYCRRGYGTLFPEDNRDDIVKELFYLADVDPLLRPFQLSVEECLRMSEVYYKFIEQNPEIANYDYRAPKIKTISNNNNSCA